MNTPVSNNFLLKIVLLSALVLAWGNTWAATGSCARTGSVTVLDGGGGTGMGGTGAIAKGTGIGGTGARPDAATHIAGNVIYSRGKVIAQSNGQIRRLAKGDPVCVGETIVSSPSGDLRIKMIDQGVVAIRPRTKLKIEKFAYNESHHDISTMTLLEGSGRFITGMIGKRYPQNDLILTKNGIIGVRGTDHEATVILPGDRRGYQPGTYDRVYQGRTYIRTAAGEIDLRPGQVGLSADDNSLPKLLSEKPDFYSTLPSASEKADPSATRDNGGDISSPENHGDAPTHEIPSFPELPELPVLPELPDLPELPELPETPELPESPDN